MTKSHKPLIRVGRRRAASILGMRLRTLEGEIAAGRITVEKIRGKEKILIRDLARWVANESELQEKEKKNEVNI